MESQHEPIPQKFLNNIMFGDSVVMMTDLSSRSVDFVLTDPPYLTSYQPRDGRKVTNDDKTGAWLEPAFQQLYRVLRDDSFCVTFYGWPAADRFVSAFRAVGFRPVSHLVFVKAYASYTGYTRAQHEVAYVLAKGRPAKPERPITDVLTWADYTGNKLHPTEKPVSVLKPLVEVFSQPGDVVLDPFCGSGSSLVAAKALGRNFIGFEIELTHAETAARRLEIRTSGKAA